MNSLEGARVALLEGRMSSELASLVQRRGGEALCVPAVRETVRSCAAEVGNLVDELSAGRYNLIICSTGAGVNALMQEAEQLGRQPELVAGLHSITVACRGPKPSAALKRHGIRATINAAAPHTTAELVAALAEVSLAGVNAVLLHYGEPNLPLTAALRARGAQLHELCLYEWLLPEDQTPLRDLIEAIICNRIDALAFTSQVQLRHLLHVAAAMSATQQLIDALNHETIVAAVGPTCARALQQAGIVPDVVPEHPKMGQMVGALAAFITREIEAGRRPSMAASAMLAA